VAAFFLAATSCRRVSEMGQEPELEPLTHGFKVSAAIGYCASLTWSFFQGEHMPDNVVIHSQNTGPDTESCILIVTIDDAHPLPFNSSIGEMTISGIWGSSGGVLTALFTDIDILEARYEFRGLYTIPFSVGGDGAMETLFAGQDIIVGEGSDTLINLSLTNPQISLETDRLARGPADNFASVSQNVWFVTVDQNQTPTDVYDDLYTVNGGGQIAEATSSTGGILYHSIINATFVPSECSRNPTSGVGFIQNLKVGSERDLGHIFLSFPDRCDGTAFVEFASGKYVTSYHRDVDLELY